MQDNFNYEKVQEATKMLLEAMGQDVNRPGLVETPRRVAGYWQELLEGENIQIKKLLICITKVLLFLVIVL